MTQARGDGQPLDGAVEMLDDWFDPRKQDDELLEETRRRDEQADALLLGRRTFEDFRGFWPNQTDDRTGVTEYLNAVRTSCSPEASAWRTL